MSATPIGDPRPSGQAGPAGDQRKAGEAGPAGDPRPAGEQAVSNEPTEDEKPTSKPAKKSAAKKK